jgi:hypothetical protein
LLEDSFIRTLNKFCGAVAITYHSDLSIFKQALQNLHKLTCKKYVHLIVSRSNVKRLSQIISDLSSKFDKIVLLEFHAIGYGKRFPYLELTRSDVEIVKSIIKQFHNKIALGASFIPLYIEILLELGYNLSQIAFVCFNYEGLLSAFIDERLNLYPNSFYPEYVSLSDTDSFLKAFNESNVMRKYRKQQKQLQEFCPAAIICNGGINASCRPWCRVAQILEVEQ